MKLVAERGVQKIHIEADSKSALTLIEKGFQRCHPCVPIIKDISSLPGHFVQIRWSHVFKEANMCVDVLTKQGHSNNWGCHVLDQVPPFLYVALFSDFLGTLFERVT